MNKNLTETSQLIDKIDAILGIEIERIRSEKEMVVIYREQHLDIIRSVRSRIFTSVGVLATALFAITALQIARENITLIRVILAVLIADFIIAGITYAFFVYHLKNANEAWFNVDDEYNRTIFDIHEQRIILIDKLLSTEIEEMDPTFNTLISYFRIVFDIYRIRIDYSHKKALEKLKSILFVGNLWIMKTFTTKVLSDDKSVLKRGDGDYKKFIKRVYNNYESKKEEFVQKKDLLPCLPQLIDELTQKYQEVAKSV
jgi:hypothetical protein